MGKAKLKHIKTVAAFVAVWIVMTGIIAFVYFSDFSILPIVMGETLTASVSTAAFGITMTPEQWLILALVFYTVVVILMLVLLIRLSLRWKKKAAQDQLNQLQMLRDEIDMLVAAENENQADIDRPKTSDYSSESGSNDEPMDYARANDGDFVSDDALSAAVEPETDESILAEVEEPIPAEVEEPILADEAEILDELCHLSQRLHELDARLRQGMGEVTNMELSLEKVLVECRIEELTDALEKGHQSESATPESESQTDNTGVTEREVAPLPESETRPNDTNDLIEEVTEPNILDETETASESQLQIALQSQLAEALQLAEQEAALRLDAERKLAELLQTMQAENEKRNRESDAFSKMSSIMQADSFPEADAQIESQSGAELREKETRIAAKINARRNEIALLRNELKDVCGRTAGATLREKFYAVLLSLDEEERSDAALNELLRNAMEDAERFAELAYYKRLALRLKREKALQAHKSGLPRNDLRPNKR